MQRELKLPPSLVIAIVAITLAGCLTDGGTGTKAAGGTASGSGATKDSAKAEEKGAECQGLADQLRACSACEAENEAVEACRAEAEQNAEPAEPDGERALCEAEHLLLKACHEACQPIAEQFHSRCGPPPPDDELVGSCHLLHAALATCHGAGPLPWPGCEEPPGHGPPKEGHEPPWEGGPPKDDEDRGPPPGDEDRGPSTGDEDRGPSTGDEDRGPPPGDEDRGEPKPPQDPPPDGDEPPPPKDEPPHKDPGDGRQPDRCASIERAIAEICALAEPKEPR